LYDMVFFNGYRYVRCLAGHPAEGRPWGTLTVADVTAAENDHAVTFTVARTSEANTIWFSYATVDGTAKAGADYTATSGTVMLGNELTKTITVPLIADAAVRTGDRAFGLRLGTVGGATTWLPARDAVATIADDEPAPEPDPPAGGTGEGQDGPVDEPAMTVTAPAPLAVPAATTPAVAPPPAPVAPAARLSQARTLTSVLAGRTRLAVRCPARCTVTATLTVSSATARVLGLRSRAIGTARGAGSGRILLPIRLTAAAKVALRRHPRTLVATAAVRDDAGASRTVRLALRAPR
jgi:hypothetical protein